MEKSRNADDGRRRVTTLDFSDFLIETSLSEHEHKHYGNCPKCDTELNDCNISCGDLCRECYAKIAIKIMPFPHDDFYFPIARGVEQRRRIWLVGTKTKTVEGIVDIVSQIDADESFRYAFASENSREQFKDYEWSGIEIFDPKRNVSHLFTCWDKYIFTRWDSLIIWMCSILNRCEYRWSISRRDFKR